MPNWVQIRFTVTGTPEQLKNFRSAVAREDANGDDLADEPDFDFNRILPMPQELTETTSGSMGSIGYDAFYGDCSAILQYPWVKNEGITTGEELMGFLDEKDPNYRIEGTKYYQNIQKYGVPTWYEWAVEHWGTKWNAGNVCIEELSDTRLEVYFDTAWSFPTPIIRQMIAMFPQLSFDGQADEEGGFFYLNFMGKDGELVVQSFEGVRQGGPYDYGDEIEEGDD